MMAAEPLLNFEDAASIRQFDWLLVSPLDHRLLTGEHPRRLELIETMRLHRSAVSLDMVHRNYLMEESHTLEEM
jgi:hypothetical protein